MKIKRRTRIALHVEERLLVQCREPGERAPIEGPLTATLRDCLLPLLERLRKENAPPGGMLSKSKNRKEQPSCNEQ